MKRQKGYGLVNQALVLALPAALITWFATSIFNADQESRGRWNEPLARALAAQPVGVERLLRARHIREISVSRTSDRIYLNVQGDDGSNLQMFVLKGDSDVFSGFPPYNFRLWMPKGDERTRGGLLAGAAVGRTTRSVEQVANEISGAFNVLPQAMDKERARVKEQQAIEATWR